MREHIESRDWIIRMVFDNVKNANKPREKLSFMNHVIKDDYMYLHVDLNFETNLHIVLFDFMFWYQEQFQ